MSFEPGTPYRIRITRRANRDLEAIFGFIGASQSIPASAWFDRLLASIGGLSAQPSSHPKTHEDPTLRHLLFGNKPHIYRVIYQIDTPKGQVNILHVRHHARQAFNPKSVSA